MMLHGDTLSLFCAAAIFFTAIFMFAVISCAADAIAAAFDASCFLLHCRWRYFAADKGYVDFFAGFHATLYRRFFAFDADSLFIIDIYCHLLFITPLCQRHCFSTMMHA